MWVARDKDEYLCVYKNKPHRGQSECSSVDKYLKLQILWE